MNIIKKQIIRIKRKRILRIIKKAKDLYIRGRYNYMCPCFERVHDGWNSYADIVKNIPEFKPATFGIDKKNLESAWWSRDEDSNKIRAVVSKSQCYKLAGNSIVVYVLYYIFRQLFIENNNKQQQLSIW